MPAWEREGQMTGIRRVLSLVIALVFALTLMLPSLTVFAAPAPTVTSSAPSGGTVAGGTTLTITGTGFAVGATATVGGYAASAIALTGTTQITALTPPHAAGSAAVVVTNTDGQSATSPTTFVYAAIVTAAPGITEYPIPTAGSAPHGIATGADGNLWFAEYYGNKIGRVTPAEVITEFSAGLTAGSGPAFITTGPGGDLWFTARDGDRIGRAKIAPRLLAAAPRSGPTTGGATVTLTGTGFLAGATVTFDGVAGTNVTVVSATQITVTTPAHPTAATVDVVVTNPGGGTDTLTHGYTYGTPNPGPPPRPPGSSGGGPPNPLPAPRPGGTIGGSAPNPVPVPRP